MDKVFVSKPFLPVKEEFLEAIGKVWDSNILTNNGEQVRNLEREISKFTNVPMVFVSNGTIALNLSYKLLNLLPGDRVLTTPFSFVATASSLAWDSIKFEFVDICSKSLNVDVRLLEEKLQKDKSYKCLVLTHVFGNPCEVEKIQKLAKKFNVKVIYDSAHCFGVEFKGNSIFSYGDISTCSFHATKVFHTVEGGGIFSIKNDIIKNCRKISNFGIDNNKEISEIGINAKNSEFHAAMGNIIIPQISKIIEERLKLVQLYKNTLGSNVHYQKIETSTKWNGAYMPVIFKSEDVLLKVVSLLEKNNIYPRRYFYPSLNKIEVLKSKNDCPVSEKIASRILCLPLFNGLKEECIKNICKTIKSCL